MKFTDVSSCFKPGRIGDGLSRFSDGGFRDGCETAAFESTFQYLRKGEILT